MLDFFHTFFAAFGLILIPYGPIVLAQVVVGVAAAPKGMGLDSVRHRDDPKAFWKMMGLQFLMVAAFCLVLALASLKPA